MAMAIQHYTLVGFAYVQVNCRKSILVTIKTGSSQGDPLSSILFFIAMGPLNCIVVTAFPELMVCPLLYADDNFMPLSLANPAQPQPILALYEEYTRVSGLNINFAKTTVLSINTPAGCATNSTSME
jgi:hypothetical protein